VVAPEFLRFQDAIKTERAAVAALNGGQLPAADGPPPSPELPDINEVKRAIRGYDAYLAANSEDKDPAKALAKRSRWIQRAKGGQQQTLAEKMTPCPEPCPNPAAVGKNAELLVQRRRLIDQELVLWDALFHDWQKTRSRIVGAAQDEIGATADGAKATTAEGKAAVARYRAAMLKEIELLASLTELSVKRADAFERGTSYTSVDAVSGASKNSKKAKAP
jgi:ribosome modulation factor